MDRTLRGAQAYSRRTAGVHQSHSKSVLLSTFKTLCLSFSGENGVAMTKPISASFSGAIGVIETCGRRIGSEPRKRVVRKGTSRFQFVPVCRKPEQTGTLMGAGPGTLPSAFICAICGSFPAGRAGGGPGAFKVQRFKVQRFKVQRFKVQRFKVQRFRRSTAPCFPVFPSSLFKGCDRVQLCCLCYLL